MAGEWSFLTTLEVGVVVVEGVVVALEALIWSAMSVVRLVTLLVNAVCVVVQEDVVAAAPLGTGGAQVMVEGATVPADGPPQDAAVWHLVGVVTAGHHRHTVHVRKCHMLMEMVWGIDAEAEAEHFRLGHLLCKRTVGLNIV